MAQTKEQREWHERNKLTEAQIHDWHRNPEAQAHAEPHRYYHGPEPANSPFAPEAPKSAPAPAPAAQSAAASPQNVGSGAASSPQIPLFQTRNGPRTATQMDAELRAVGWGGGEDVATAYARTTGGPVVPMGLASSGGAGPTTNAAGTGIDPFWQQFYQAQTDSARQKAERDWQEAQERMALARNADERAQALLDLQKATNELSRLQFEESKFQFREQLANTQQQQYASLATTLMGLSNQVQGPQDWLKYAQTQTGGRGLLNTLYGDQPAPAATQGGQAKTLQDVLAGLGIGAPAQPPQVQTQAASGQRFAGGSADFDESTGQYRTAQAQQPNLAPRPWQINPVVWDSLPDSAKLMTLGMANAGQTEGGFYESADFLRQLNAQRPQGTAPRMTRTAYKEPTGFF